VKKFILRLGSLKNTINKEKLLFKIQYNILILFYLLNSEICYNQAIRYYYQSFESTSGNNCPENWPYTGGNRNIETARTGSYSSRVGRLGESTALTMQTLDVSNLSNPTLTLYHSIRSGSGPGMDTREGAVILVSLNGGVFTFLSGVGGFSDHGYPWTSTVGGSASSSAGCNIYQTQNALQYNIPSGTTSISVQVISIRVSSTNCTTYNTNMNSGIASNYDRADEGFFVDDIEIKALAPTLGATNNGIICLGNPLNLYTNPSLNSMASSWTGPNTFSSIDNNPLVTTNATTLNTGNYSNTINVNNCSIGSYSINVTIQYPPTIIFLSPP